MTGRAMRLAYRNDHRTRRDSWLEDTSSRAVDVVFRDLYRLAKEYFSEIVLQQKRIRDTQAREELDDIAVQQNRLPAARGRVGAVLEIHFVGNNELGVARFARLRGPEEPKE